MSGYVLMTGNPVDGFTLDGPFTNHDEAMAYGEWLSDCDWWIVAVKSPDSRWKGVYGKKPEGPTTAESLAIYAQEVMSRDVKIRELESQLKACRLVNKAVIDGLKEDLATEGARLNWVLSRFANWWPNRDALDKERGIE